MKCKLAADLVRPAHSYYRQRGRGETYQFRQNRKVLSADRMAAYSGVFPGYTVNQIIRLNDAALDSNKVVPKFSAVR
jgi:hypothetical protein